MDIVIYDETNAVDPTIVTQTEQLLNFAADWINLAENTEMSVTFVDNVRIRAINNQYRHIDRATDVISFAIEDETEEELPIIFAEGELLPPRNLGDLFISIEKATEQATAYGHSLEREYGFLAVHGFLHLNGYDHQTVPDEKTMFTLQEEILHAYGLEREQAKEV